MLMRLAMRKPRQGEEPAEEEPAEEKKLAARAGEPKSEGKSARTRGYVHGWWASATALQKSSVLETHPEVRSASRKQTANSSAASRRGLSNGQTVKRPGTHHVECHWPTI